MTPPEAPEAASPGALPGPETGSAVRVCRSALWLLFLASFGFFGLFAHGYVENTDAEVTMHAAKAFWERGDFGLREQGEGVSAGEAAIVRSNKFGMAGANGRYYVWFPIGHQLLMVPCVALGELFARWFPGPEATYLELKTPVFGEFYWARFFVSMLPILAAAGSVVMLLLIALALGCRPAQALLVVVIATLCTQFWPGASETMSDGPGMFFALAMAALVFRYHAGQGGVGAMLAVGLCGGCAVFVRYPLVLVVLVLAAVAATAAVRRDRWKHTAWLAMGAAPAIVGILLANYLRFGDPFTDAYGKGANELFWSYPSYLGIPCILAAPGKGLLWFSPPVWLALTQVRWRALLTFPWLPVLAILVAPVVMHGHTAGWAAGQCWGIRYVTPSVVLLVTVALACGKPWQRRPGWCAAVCLLGLVVSLGGVLTPYRGQQHLANVAGRIKYDNAEQVDNNINFDPRFSPVHTHWTYLGLSATGRLEQGGSANTTEPLFGVVAPDAAAVVVHPGEDVRQRHWWIVFMRHHFDLPLWLAGVWLAGTGVLLGLAVRALRPG